MIEIIYAKRKSIRYIAFIRSKNIHITPCYPWADPNAFSRVVLGKFKFPVGGGGGRGFE